MDLECPKEFSIFFGCKNTSNHSLNAHMCFAHTLVFILYIVIEVTMNMAKYATNQQQPKNVNFEPIIRGLKDDIFD